MAQLLRTVLLVALVSLAFTGVAQAAGGNYGFDSGTPKQQAQVRKALDASSFNWSVVPTKIRIHIGAGYDNEATRGDIWIDANLLNSGKFAWGIIQHEYAHQVDFFLLDDSDRAQLATRLGGVSWWGIGSADHDELTSERFASTLAWAYWQTKDNCLRPTSPKDESAALPPAKFRSLLATTLAAS
jgi:hypothetical protein